MRNSKLKVLVTGGAGFVASHLIETLLNRGHSVIALDNFDPFYSRELKEKNIKLLCSNTKGNFKFYELNICNKEQLKQIKEPFEVVVHIAAKAGVRPSISKPNEYINTNIKGTQNVLEFMMERDCKKLVFASSSSIYGNNKKVPFSEKDNVSQPISPYAFTKRANELQLFTTHSLYKFNVLCLRFFTVYGPRQRPDLAIRKFINLISQDKKIEMYGDGNSGRDYTYVSDIVDGIISSISYVLNQKNVYEIINLGNHSPIRLKDMIDTIYKEMGAVKNVTQLPMQAGDVDLTYADINKARKLLGYEPKVSFEEGIKKTIAWFHNINGS